MKKRISVTVILDNEKDEEIIKKYSESPPWRISLISKERTGYTKNGEYKEEKSRFIENDEPLE